MASNTNKSVELKKIRIVLMRSAVFKKASQDEQKIKQKQQTLLTSKTLCPF